MVLAPVLTGEGVPVGGAGDVGEDIRPLGVNQAAVYKVEVILIVAEGGLLCL